MGFVVLNYRWVFSAGRFLQSAIASGTSNPKPGGPVIRTFQLLPPGVPTPETTRANPSSGRWNYGQENFREFCQKWRLPRHFWVLLHAVNLRHGTDGFTSPPEERRAEDFFARKIWRLWPGLNPRTRVPEASTLTSKPPKPLTRYIFYINMWMINHFSLNWSFNYVKWDSRWYQCFTYL